MTRRHPLWSSGLCLFIAGAFAMPFAASAQASFGRNLAYGMSSPEVRDLQRLLNSDPATRVALVGPGAPGSESAYFGALTRAAAIKFQRKHGIAPAVGFVGPLTRAKLNSLASNASRQEATAALPLASATAIAERSADEACNASLFKDGLSPRRMITLSACETLNELYREGKAAGNTGDLYDNRDGLHVNFCEGWSPRPECPKPYRLFPQHEWKLSGGAGAATSPSAQPTLGQASYSGLNQGDIKRGILYAQYGSQERASALYRMYVNNNFYVYPSLYDDSYAGSSYAQRTLEDPSEIDRASMNRANTPYAVASKQICKCGAGDYRIHDASGSDLSFIELGFAGLAAFKPEVKSALKEGVVVGGERVSLLMPTLQAMIRYSHVSVDSEDDYLKSPVHGAAYLAHRLVGGAPSPAFSSDELVSMTNSLALSDVPPLVRLSVESEDFTSAETLFTTPGAVARTVGQASPKKSITVSASGSVDSSGSSAGLEYRFVPFAREAEVAVDPRDPSRATIVFSPGAKGRIDVGVFVKKAGGAYYSTPGIVSVYVNG